MPGWCEGAPEDHQRPDDEPTPGHQAGDPRESDEQAGRARPRQTGDEAAEQPATE